jgi:MFS transporter, FSR family, fosmidomycin resistance protein
MNEKRRILTTVSMYHAINDGAVAVVPILFPIFKSIFNLSYTEIGIITGTGLLVNLIAQLLIGNISDGKNTRTMLSLGVLLISISLFTITFTKGFVTLFIFIIFLRISSSFFHPIGTGWISRIFKREKLDWAMGVQSGFADFGVFIAISTTLYVTTLTSWDFPLYIWSFAAGLIVLSGIILTRNVQDENLIVKNDDKKITIQERFNESIAFIKKIKLLLPASIISGASWGVVITYLPLLLDEKTDLSLSLIGLILAVWIGIGCISSFNYGKIAEKIGRKKVLILSYIIIGFTSLSLSFITNVIIIIPIVAMLGIAVFVTFPALASFVSEITSESCEGRTFGTMFTFQLAGGTLLLFLGGYLSDIFGIWIPFLLLGIMSLFSSLLFLVYRKKSFIIS